MSINLGITESGNIKITTGPYKVRKDNMDKWLGRNRDAVLVKLKGHPEAAAPCSPGHVCRIENEGNQMYNVFIGNHLIGQLPEEAISFAHQVNSSPEYLLSIVGKVENDDVFIYIAE